MPKKLFRLPHLLIMILLILSACNFPGESQTSTPSALSQVDMVNTMVAQTVAAAVSNATLLTPVKEQPSDGTPVPLTHTLQPGETMTPTITLTSTPDKPMISVSVNTNCRTGPGTSFEIVDGLLVGEQSEVVGVPADGRDYWVIKNPHMAGTCWLWGEYATVVGPTGGLITYEIPPTPTPTLTPTPEFYWNGTWSIYFANIGDPPTDGAYTMLTTTNGSNYTGNVTIPTGTIVLSGMISANQKSVSGSWTNTTTAANGSFTFYSIGINQFKGQYNEAGNPTSYAWCGGRGGAAPPNPCYSP